MHVRNAARDNRTVIKSIFLTLICISLTVICILNPTHSSQHITQILHTLTQEERSSLEWFFRCFAQDSSYVLFGTKPMAFCHIRKIDACNLPVSNVYNFMDSISQFHLCNLLKKDGWETWGKYQHLFPSSNYIFVENNDPKSTTIFLINKREFLKKITENIAIFRDTLGTQVTPQKILTECLQSNNIIKEVLKNNDALLGILLGFGTHNAQLFWRMQQLEEARTPETEEEYKNLQSRLAAFSDHHTSGFNFLLLPLPGFSADLECLETKQLKSAYTRQHKNIIQKYRNQDFLEVTLEQIVRD